MSDRRASVVHKSLLEQQMFAGVDKKIAIFNGTIAIAVSFATKSLWYVPVAMAFHEVMRWLHKRDPYVYKVYMRYNVLGRVYDPWPRNKMTTNERPEGFSKGLLC